MDDMECKCEECPPKGAPGWMVTFGDLMSLLLTFFILLLSFASMDKTKFEEALGSLQDALGVTAEQVGKKVPTEQLQASMISLKDEQNQEKLTKKIMNFAIKKYGMEDKADVTTDARGVIVRVNGAVFFEPGQSKLKKSSEKIIKKISTIMKKFSYELQIEGHTDNRPIRSTQYPSNWELSASRAASVLKYVQKQGRIEKTRLSVVGRADTRPIVPNNSTENRAKNRRIEFVFVKLKI